MTQRLDMVFLYVMEIYEGFKNVIQEVGIDSSGQLWNMIKYVNFL